VTESVRNPTRLCGRGGVDGYLSETEEGTETLKGTGGHFRCKGKKNAPNEKKGGGKSFEEAHIM